MLTVPLTIVATRTTRATARPRFTAMTMRRRSNRSAAAPPRTPKSRVGRYSLRTRHRHEERIARLRRDQERAGREHDAVADVVDERGGEEPAEAAAEPVGTTVWAGRAIRERTGRRIPTHRDGGRPRPRGRWYGSPTEGSMEFGVHLPQIDWGDERVSLDRLIAFATAAQRLGFGTISANDHLVYQRSWLDGPTALAAVMAAAGGATDDDGRAPRRAGPVRTGQVPGGHRPAVERPARSRGWSILAGGLRPRRHPVRRAMGTVRRSHPAMRAVWSEVGPPFAGRFYDTTGVTLAPRPAQPDGPPIWIGSWGSTRACGGWHAWAMVGSPRATTRRRRTSGRRGRSGRDARGGRPARHGFRRHWRRRGCTSPTIRRRNATSPRG